MRLGNSLLLLAVFVIGQSLSSTGPPRIECTDSLCSAYGLLSPDGTILLRSPGVPVAVCAARRWQTEMNGGLERIGNGGVPEFANPTLDAISERLNALPDKSNSLQIAFNVTPTGERVIVTAASLNDLSTVIFTTIFPDGMRDTGGCRNANTDPGGQIGTIVSGWPSFSYPSTVYSDPLPYSLSFEGSFLRPLLGKASTGPRGGPLLLFGDKYVVVGSPIDNYGAWSAGAGSSHDGSIPDLWNPGLPISIKTIPKGWSSSTLLHVTSVREDDIPVSVTGALHAWGAFLQEYHNSTLSKDVTLDKIGMQTDNGAFYCFCKGNCSDTLLKKVDEFKDLGIPMGYVSFQGAGASMGRGTGAPWCVSRWGPDGGLGPNYPLPLSDFQRELRLPLQLYAPYFCGAANDYINATGGDWFGGSKIWRGVRSNTSLPGCKDYDFWDISPKLSKQFYDWFFAKGVSVGMVSFEPDFMNQNRNCVPEFRETVDGAMMWQHGMAFAALDAGLSVQWCYATPSDILASLELDSVTNFRVSTDFCYGESWDIGISSLLPSALGKAPSKDTLWSTRNNGTEIPGCSWTPDHEDAGAALHVTLALLSTGPVGISDGIGYTNKDLLKPIISADGSLLKPSRPATLIDSLLRMKSSSNMIDIPRQGQASGEVYVSHSKSETDDEENCVRAWYILSFKVEEQFLLDKSDLYPRPCAAQAKEVFPWRRFDSGENCKDNVHAFRSGCLVDGSSVQIPASNFSNTTIGTEFSHVLTTIYAMQCSSGWRPLGELKKTVSLSVVRFPSINCVSDGLNVGLIGTIGETVQIAAVDPNNYIRSIEVEIKSDTIHKVFFQANKISLNIE